MKIIVCLIAALSLSFNVWADESNKEVLACMGGTEVSVNGSKTSSANAAEIRFLLTLQKKGPRIIRAHIKYTGEMEGYPGYWSPCHANGAKNLYTCANGADVIWYFPSRKHGIKASISGIELFEEERANSAYLYNYSCTDF
jgi:hypothetical protein